MFVRRLFSFCVLFLVASIALTGTLSCGTSSTRPQYLGVITEDTTITDLGGVLLTAVVSGSAAEQAGLLANDILGKMDGSVVVDFNDLRSKIAAKTLGQSAHFDFFRPSTATTSGLDVLIGADSSGTLPNVLGFSVGAGTNAVSVTSVTSGGVADQGNLEVNDQITTVNGSPTTKLSDAFRAFAGLTSGGTVTLQYLRPGSPNINSQGQDIGYSLQLKAGTDAASSIPVPGLFGQDLTPALAVNFGYLTSTGAGIITLYRDSPAFDAGLLVGDIIFGFTPLDTGEAEIAVTTANILTNLAKSHAGQNVQLRYLRGEQPPATVDVVLSGVPSTSTPAPNIGMTFVPANNATGLAVETIVTGGAAATAGIAIDDRITLVNHAVVNSTADFWDALLPVFDAGVLDASDKIDVVVQDTPPTGPPKFVILALTPVQ